MARGQLTHAGRSRCDDCAGMSQNRDKFSCFGHWRFVLDQLFLALKTVFRFEGDCGLWCPQKCKHRKTAGSYVAGFGGRSALRASHRCVLG